jgi:hypothetical protein
LSYCAVSLTENCFWIDHLFLDEWSHLLLVDL